MPRYPIDRATNFIIEDESWTVIEYDHTSVPGTIYLSLTEGKVNSIYDDLDNNIADTDKLANYELVLPDTDQVFAVGDEIAPQFTLMKDGVIYSGDTNLLSSNKVYAKYMDGVLTATSAGEVDILVQLADYTSIQLELPIIISDEVEQEFGAYIEGADSIRLDRSSVYELKGTSDLEDSVSFYLDDTSYASIDITTLTSVSCTVVANAKDLLGDVTLHATYNDNDYTKTISIIPLW